MENRSCTPARRAPRSVAAALLLLLPCSLVVERAAATTVLRVDVDYLVENAGLIFEGQVIAHDAAWNAAKTAIQTAVTFHVSEVIKGRVDGDTLTLKYAGGVVDGRGMAVSSMVYPAVGEKGIYFIENPGAEQANPMLGWGQGHFVIGLDSSGSERILTEDLRPVLTIENTATAPRAPSRAAQVEFSEGVARGVKVGDQGADRSLALGKAAFKAELRSRMAPSAPERAD